MEEMNGQLERNPFGCKEGCEGRWSAKRGE